MIQDGLIIASSKSVIPYAAHRTVPSATHYFILNDYTASDQHGGMLLYKVQHDASVPQQQDGLPCLSISCSLLLFCSDMEDTLLKLQSC